MDKAERERLRQDCQNFIGRHSYYYPFEANAMISLIDHIDALEQKVEKAEEVIRIVADPDVFPSYHSQGMGCGLEDRCITDRYEAMRYGWESLADRVYDEVIIVAAEYLEAIAAAPEPQ